MSTNYEKLKGMIKIDLNSEASSELPPEAELENRVTVLRETLNGLYPVSDEEFKRLLHEIKSLYSIKLDMGVAIEEKKEHQSWLPFMRKDLDFYFWRRYKEYLESEKGWSSHITLTLGKIADEILDLCGNPHDNAFSRKGLILGDVQSGKTANYTAICNKAADVGYKIIIVLAGMTNSLRRQTQERLDMEFIGRNSDSFLETNQRIGRRHQRIGVGKNGISIDEKEIITFTSTKKDFDTHVLHSNNLGLDQVRDPVVLVVKKNKKVLTNLINWLSINNTQDGSDKIDLPLLLIDDEADNASVNTADIDEEPKAINNCIRQLLQLFRKHTYLGVTATPFANIFINAEDEDDLFPENFIYLLEPPSNYIGAKEIFADIDEEGIYHRDMLEVINENNMETYLPLRHKQEHTLGCLPEDLRKAIYYFFLVNAIRDFRHDEKAHRAMMINISRFNKIQKVVSELAYEFWYEVESDIKLYGCLGCNNARKSSEHIAKLENIWNEFDLENVSKTTWENILENYLYKAVSPIEIKLINQEVKEAAIDYSKHKDNGLRAIVIGGHSLSRGLTLEGLCVTYFYRVTNMYDSLLQMGRWFGYRDNYADLVKIWMTAESIDWYGQITDCLNELKQEIKRMHNLGKTPKEFGFKVRQAPGPLIVTARNKMRHANEVKLPVSVSGRLVETPRLKNSQQALEQNESLFRSFVKKLDYIGVREDNEEITGKNYFWKNVPASDVSAFVSAFDVHPWHLSFNSQSLSEYIEQEDWKDGWDVVLVSIGSGECVETPLTCGDELLYDFRPEKRKVLIRDDMLSITGTNVTVGSGGCTKYGLTAKERKAAEEEFFKYSKASNVSNNTYLIETRRPILMLHVLQANYTAPCNQLPKYLYAIGLGFPRNSQSNKTAIYKINTVQFNQYLKYYEEAD